MQMMLFFNIIFYHTMTDLCALGCANESLKGGMGGGLRGSVGSGFGAGAGRAPTAPTDSSTSTSTPPINPYSQPGIPLGDNLSQYIPKAADAQARPGLPRGVWISDTEFVPLPPRDVNNAIGGQSVNDILAAQYAKDRSSQQLPLARSPTLLTYDAQGNVIQLARFTPPTPYGAQAEGNSSTATEFYRTPTQYAQS